MSSPSATRPPSRGLNREILALAIPSIATAISVPLVGIADTALVGRLGPVAYIGAVSIGAMIFDALYWVFGFLRMGTTAIVAQAYGAGDDRRAGQALTQSAIMALVVGVLIVVLRVVIMKVGLHFAGGTPEVKHWAEAYIGVRILGAPAVLLTFALNGFFRGMKDAVTPLVVTITVNVVNLVGDVGLIHGLFGMPRLGVVGAAWASLAGAIAGVTVALSVLLLRYRRPLRLALSDFSRTGGVFDRRRMRRLMTAHTHLFNRTLLLMAAYFIMVGVAARLGEVPLAANAILLQLWYLAAYAIDGFAFAAETLIGNALGAAEALLTRRLVRRLLAWGFGFSLVFSMVYLFQMRQIASAFTKDEEVVLAVVELTLLMAATQPINALAFVYDGIFIGANDMRFLSIQIAISCLGVFVPAVLLLTRVIQLGLPGLWIAMALFSLTRAIILLVRLRQRSWIDDRIREASMSP